MRNSSVPACLPSMHKGPGPNYPADKKKGWKSRREGKGKGQGREMKKSEEIEMRRKKSWWPTPMVPAFRRLISLRSAGLLREALPQKTKQKCPTFIGLLPMC